MMRPDGKSVSGLSFVAKVINSIGNAVVIRQDPKLDSKR